MRYTRSDVRKNDLVTRHARERPRVANGDGRADANVLGSDKRRFMIAAPPLAKARRDYYMAKGSNLLVGGLPMEVRVKL